MEVVYLPFEQMPVGSFVWVAQAIVNAFFFGK